MGKKGRKTNSKKKGDDSDDGGMADYLSETHTIATLADSSGLGGNNDDDWGLEDHDEDDGKHKAQPSELDTFEARLEKCQDCFSTVEDYLSEKRSAKREQYLKAWFKGLTQYVTSTDLLQAAVMPHQEGLIQACRFGIRQGTPSEQYAACRVLEAGAIFLSGDDWYAQVETHLTRILSASHRAILVRQAALKALGMAVFIGVDDDQITEQVMDLCESLAQPTFRGDAVPAPVRATALEVWTLLATTIHDLYISGKDDVSVGRGLVLLPLLLQCLEQTEDLSLRSAAGECVTWIHTARVNLGALAVADLQSSDNPDATARKYAKGSWEGSEWEDIMAEIEQVVDDLSNQSGHHLSKKVKKEVRATFREYLATLQNEHDEEEPLQVVQFRGGNSLELTQWKEVIALNFLRRCLQGGFQIQLLTNTTLQTILGADGNILSSTGNLSALEKRLFLSKNAEVSKAKDLDRHKKRNVRHNIKNHFLTVDGDDI